MVIRRAERGEMRDTGVGATCIWGTFDLLEFKIIAVHTMHLSQNNM